MEKIQTYHAIAQIRTRSVWRRILDAVLAADARHRQDHALRNLPTALRRDIGVAQKTGWQPPLVMRNTQLW